MRNKRYNWNKDNKRELLKKYILSSKTLSEIQELMINDYGIPTQGAIIRQALELGFGVNGNTFTSNPRSRKKNIATHETSNVKDIIGEYRGNLAECNKVVDVIKALEEVTHKLHKILGM